MDCAPFKKPGHKTGLFSYRSVLPPSPHETLLCKLPRGPRPLRGMLSQAPYRLRRLFVRSHRALFAPPPRQAAKHKRPLARVDFSIKTTGLAGGLSKPYKGIILAKPLKGPRMGLPTAFLSRGRPLKGPLFYALVFLLPVNGSTNSLRLSWSAI